MACSVNVRNMFGVYCHQRPVNRFLVDSRGSQQWSNLPRGSLPCILLAHMQLSATYPLFRRFRNCTTVWCEAMCTTRGSLSIFENELHVLLMARERVSPPACTMCRLRAASEIWSLRHMQGRRFDAIMKLLASFVMNWFHRRHRA